MKEFYTLLTVAIIILTPLHTLFLGLGIFLAAVFVLTQVYPLKAPTVKYTFTKPEPKNITPKARQPLLLK